MAKTILITGAAQGIGRAIAELLLQDVDTKLIVIDKQRTKFIDEMAERQGDRFRFYLQDLAERDALATLLTELAILQIDGVVNNAGEVYLEKWDKLELKTWDRTLAVNATAPLQVVHALRNALSKGASIVNIASTDGMVAAFDTVAYGASKAALINLTKSMAANLGARNVRVNAIAPGWIETEMTKGTMPEESSWITPLQRDGQAKEVAQVAAFLLSDASSFVNGEVITVDGGLSAIDFTLKQEASD